jgi:hypothetical protein
MAGQVPGAKSYSWSHHANFKPHVIEATAQTLHAVLVRGQEAAAAAVISGYRDVT